MTTVADPHAIDSEALLRELYGTTHPLAVAKCLLALDVHCIDFIARSPFLCMATQSAAGRADVSPRGDPPGFVKVVSATELVIPDRPGNNRLDSLSNIIANPSVGLVFFVPGFDETLRVNGTARLSREPTLLASLAVNDRVPSLAIVLTIDEAFLHCAKALRRSSLWDPTSRQDRREMPSLSKMILDQTVGAPTDAREMQRVDDELETAYRESLY